MRKRISSGSVAAVAGRAKGASAPLARLPQLLPRPIQNRDRGLASQSSASSETAAWRARQRAKSCVASSSGIWSSLAAKVKAALRHSALAASAASRRQTRSRCRRRRPPRGHVGRELAGKVGVHHRLRVQNQLAERLERHQRARGNQPVLRSPRRSRPRWTRRSPAPAAPASPASFCQCRAPAY